MGETINAFRAWHLPAVSKVQEQLVSLFHEEVSVPPRGLPITSRLKTSEAIVAKLRRTPTTLTRMQDIAGARIVVPTLAVQDPTLALVTRVFEGQVVDVKDQREQADEHGYRAIHVIVRTAGRLAEIQIRTTWQDRWAQLVEGVDSRVIEGVLNKFEGTFTIEMLREEVDLKHGVGPADLLEWLKVASDEFRKADLGQPFEIPPYDALTEQSR